MGANFAVKLQALMRYKRISQEALAPRLGITQSAVSQLLRAKEIKLSHAFILAKLFDVSIDYLADPAIPLHSENELALEQKIRDLVIRLGPDRAYNRLILAEKVEIVPPNRPQDLPEDGVYGPAMRAADPMPGARKSRRKPNQ